jgi:dTMP kinase
MSLLIALEGIDGSGKGTQSQRLQQTLRADGHRVALLSFPRYEETFFGQAIGEFLNGRFGALDQVHPQLAALLFAGDRFESRDVIAQALREHDIVLCDRYVASNIAHQAAKLEQPQRCELQAWITKLEFEVYALPRPDLTLLLDLPATTAQQLIARKSPRSYTDKAADLQEADAHYLQRVRQVYLELEAADPRWHRIEVERDNELRSIDDVADDVAAVVRQAAQQRTPK